MCVEVKRKWPAVEVVWRDAHGGDEGWTKVGKHHGQPAECRTVGMLAKTSKHGLVVVLSLDKSAAQFGGYVFIPHINVVTMRELS